ncbi:CACNA1G [Cordylochernes scorpioides]|uniref:CACNA1G n=1 Tax=Cordylochernes scorpioides TaxID=51811 RepID=A0ABY6LR77_9ARAC|nr:CACNA1G [Cordylochernes scorpioides]
MRVLFGVESLGPQILTQEDWNIVLFNGMERTSHWAALYFVALMTFGNYVLFNLLVAILVEGFSAEGERKRAAAAAAAAAGAQDTLEDSSSSKKAEWNSSDKHTQLYLEIEPKNNIKKEQLQGADMPLITHTAATPQGSPNTTLEPVLNNKLLLGSSLESIDKSPQNNPMSSPSLYGTKRDSLSVHRNSLTPNNNGELKKKENGDHMSRKGSICSWRKHRGRKKSSLMDSESESEGEEDETEGEQTVLNNNHHHPDHRQCNGGLRNSKNLLASSRSPSPRGPGPPPLPAAPDPSRHNSLASADFKPNNLEQPTATDVKSDRSFKLCWFVELFDCLKEREDYALFIFPLDNKFRKWCKYLADAKWFDYIILVFIAMNCITLAMERPNIPPNSLEREVLSSANYVFTVVFAIEMFIKVVAKGLWYGKHAYFKNGWNKMDGTLVLISLVDFLLSFMADGSPRIFGILRVFRLLRSLRPLRYYLYETLALGTSVINRAPGLKLVVSTLLSSLRPIGNIVLICCTFFIIFGILGVQLFKGSLYYCEGTDVRYVRNRSECLANKKNVWINQKYNFDNLGQVLLSALMALFVLSSKDGWVNIMYTGLDAVGVDQQPIENYSEWRLLYFISFLLLVAFFVLNMFVGVVVENFHRCREEQEREEKARRAEKRARKLELKKRSMENATQEFRQAPYYASYSRPRLFTHNIVTSKYFDLAIAAVIGLNVVTMATEFYKMPLELIYTLKIFNYFFTAVFILESMMKVLALGIPRYLKDKWNQLDVVIVILSIVGIVLEEMESDVIPINPTIIRVMRVLRIARVLKLLKMAKGIRALLDTVMQALPQVGNLGLLFFLLFFIFAALGVELFGRLECTDEFPCQGLGEHAHFRNFGMAFLTLFRVATGDNWNGIMKDTLRDNCDSSSGCVRNCCVSPVIAPLYFVVFVLMAQFVLVNVVVAVLMKHLEESHKQMDDDIDLDLEIEHELARLHKSRREQLEIQTMPPLYRPVVKMASLPANFTFRFQEDNDDGVVPPVKVTVEMTDPMFPDMSPPPHSAPNINLKQVSPEEPCHKVTVADLSHIPPCQEGFRQPSVDSTQSSHQSTDSAPTTICRLAEPPPLLTPVTEDPSYVVYAPPQEASAPGHFILVGNRTLTVAEPPPREEEEDSVTSTQCLLQQYPELMEPSDLESASWPASGDASLELGASSSRGGAPAADDKEDDTLCSSLYPSLASDDSEGTHSSDHKAKLIS